MLPPCSLGTIQVLQLASNIDLSYFLQSDCTALFSCASFFTKGYYSSGRKMPKILAYLYDDDVQTKCLQIYGLRIFRDDQRIVWKCKCELMRWWNIDLWVLEGTINKFFKYYLASMYFLYVLVAHLHIFHKMPLKMHGKDLLPCNKLIQAIGVPIASLQYDITDGIWPNIIISFHSVRYMNYSLGPCIVRTKRWVIDVYVTEV